MKKIIMVLFFMFLLTGCSSDDIKYINSRVELDFSACKVVTKYDDHGGFLGDGERFIKLECPDNMYEKPNHWKYTPYTEGILEATKLVMCNGDGCYDIYEKFGIPKEVDGYYFIFDRHSDATNRYSDSELNNRTSYNYTFAIFDNEEKVLYFYEIDT